MDEQTVTHIRNTFRGGLIDWFDSLQFLGIHIINIRTAFETNFRAAPSLTSIVRKAYKILNLDE